MQVAVIGLGVAGASTCRQLASRGHKVSGFEQFTIGSDRASSFGESRIIRYTYPDPFYTTLMAKAYALWGEIQAEARQELLVQTGVLIIGPQHLPAMEQVSSSLMSLGIDYKVLTPDECSAVASGVHLQRNEVAIHQPAGGFLRATRCLKAICAQAEASGAVLLENIAVRHIEDGTDCVRLVFDDGSSRTFDKVVVAAGPWITKILPNTIPATVTRQEIAYFKIDFDAALFAPDRMPVWIDLKTLTYGFPLDGVIDGVKVASHKTGIQVDPDEPHKKPDSLYQQELAFEAQRRLPGLSGKVIKSQVCMYTNTPDEDFVLDWVPGSDHVFIVSGCSGHGFKFAPLLGEIAAACVCHQAPGCDMSRFSLARFHN